MLSLSFRFEPEAFSPCDSRRHPGSHRPPFAERVSSISFFPRAFLIQHDYHGDDARHPATATDQPADLPVRHHQPGGFASVRRRRPSSLTPSILLSCFTSFPTIYISPSRRDATGKQETIISTTMTRGMSQGDEPTSRFLFLSLYYFASLLSLFGVLEETKIMPMRLGSDAQTGLESANLTAWNGTGPRCWRGWVFLSFFLVFFFLFPSVVLCVL